MIEADFMGTKGKAFNMEGLFSFLGSFGKKSTLTGQNQELSMVMKHLLPEAPEQLDFRGSLYAFLDQVRTLCDAYIIYSPLPESTNLQLFKNGNKVWKLCAAKVKSVITEEINNDLNYVTVASFRYTASMCLGPKIINGTKLTPSVYIQLFDGIRNDGRGRSELRKLLQNSGEWFNRSDYVFPTNMALTVLPQFIRRYYDMGITFDNNLNPVLPSADEIKAPVMSSIFDIGPVLGLLGVSTPRKNPYIKRDGIAADIDSFVRSFASAPLSVDAGRNDLLSARQILDRAADIAIKAKEEDAVTFLRSVSAEELVAFDQFAIERFAHAAFINSALKEEREDDLLSYIHFHGYILPTALEIISLPLPKTRIKLLEAIQNQKNIEEFARKCFPNTKITDEIRQVVMSIFADYIRKFVSYWRDVVIPVHILAFHYFAKKNAFHCSFDELQDFFSYFVSYYDFYTYDGNGDVCLNCKKRVADAVEMNKRAKVFYNVFDKDTSEQARENKFYRITQLAEDIKAGNPELSCPESVSQAHYEITYLAKY